MELKLVEYVPNEESTNLLETKKLISIPKLKELKKLEYQPKKDPNSNQIMEKHKISFKKEIKNR